MKIIIDNKLSVQGAPVSFQKALKERLTLKNPKWFENNMMNRWQGDTPRQLRFYKVADNGLIVPRGFARQLIGMARKLDVSYQIDDQRRSLPEVDFTFYGKLRPFQERAVKDVLKRDFGTLSAATGSGKTVVALYIIAERKQPALIVVHTKELLNQWLDQVETFLNIPKKDIGIIGNGKKTVGQQIMVATVQSLYKCADEVSQHIGHLIVDEAHRAPARTFSEAVTAFDCRYMLGLSATPWRRDGLSRLIYWHIGDVTHEINKADLISNGDILQADIVIRETNFTTCIDPSTEYSKMLSELTQDVERNRLIAKDVATEAKNGGGICLALSDRKAHCAALQQVLSHNFNVSSVLLTGDIPAKQRQDIVNRLNQGKIKVLVATGSLLGEGFDCKQLSTLFLTTPIKFDGRVIQYLGRVLRPAPGKAKPKVYDYVDIHIGPLKASAQARRRVYGNGSI